MKKLLCLIFAAAALLCGSLAFAESADELVVSTFDYYTENDIKEVADKLFTLMDENSDTKEMLGVYKNGEYLKALGLYRNYIIDRIRKTPIDPVTISGYSWDYWTNSAEYMVGRMTLEEVNAKYAHRKDLKPFEDYENVGAFIDSSKPSAINWCTLGMDKDLSKRIIVNDDAGHGLTILASKYNATGDTVYLSKMTQIMEDFAENFQRQYDEFYGIGEMSFRERGQKAMAESIMRNGAVITTSVYLINQAGSCAAKYNVTRAQRSKAFWWMLHITAKSLPGENYPPKYENAYYNTLLPQSITVKPYPEAYNYIDPVRFAKFMHHLLTIEYETMSESVIYFPGGTPNISLEATRNSLIYAGIFKDFSKVLYNINELIAAANDRMGKTTYRDGGALEKSFNYNETDIGERKSFATLITSLAPEFVTEKGLMDFSQQGVRWELLKEAYTSPLGLLPRIGNLYRVYGTETVWKDEEKMQALRESLGDTKQAYKSVYLPYSGYGAMRSGWDTTDLYMAFFNDDKRNMGHMFVGTNAVMNLTAYGRTLLMGGGVAYYGKSYVSQYPEFLEDGYAEINGYFSEDSSQRISTVMVNDKSQVGKNYHFDEVGDYDSVKNSGANKWGYTNQFAEDVTLPNRWLTDSHFDFCEGSYGRGYMTGFGDMEQKNNTPPQEKLPEEVTDDATHNRQFIYVKDADLFIVTDEMENTYKLSNKYRALWHFQAYLEGDKLLTGFRDDQIVVDSENKRFYTTDSTGPNLFAYNFSDEDLSYERYCGYYKKGELAWGWADGGTDVRYAKFTPRTEVHVRWEDEKRGDRTQVATVLAPSKTDADPIVSREDLSDESKVAFRIKTSSGKTVEYYNFYEKTRFYQDGINAIVQTLVLVMDENGNKVSALVGNCDYAIVNNIIPVYMMGKNCSFEFGKNGLINKVTQFDVPEFFEWKGDIEGEHYPVYTKNTD